MLERLMLAQAQECVFENTIAKGSSHSVCSKISRQVGLYYEETLAALSVAPLTQHFDKTWLSHVQLKAALFYAEACYRYSLELHDKEEIGEEIARLKSGIGALTDAKKSSPKGAAQQLLDAINKLETNMKTNLERALKENDRVYLMRVPTPSSLSPLPAFAMVKPLNMSEVLDASKERMFASIVPDSSAKALSRYTEMVDDIIRTQAEKLQQGSELARVSLKEMDLPDSILALEGHSVLPTPLWEDVEAVQISGGPAGLDGELQQLRDLRRVNNEFLVQTEELLQKEAAEDTQFRSQFGTRWTRPQSSTLTKNLQDRLNRFAANLKQAADSDGKIERSVRDNMALMSILDRRPVGLYYEETLAALSVAPLTQHFDKTWLSHVQLKAALFYAEACYRYSLELHDKEEIGEEIARLKSGIGALTDAKKSSPKGAAQQLLDAINKLETNMKTNLERALKENDRVYLMRVPTPSSLSPLPAFAMVKPLNMSEVLDASKERMFASIVPDSSAKALSRYTEMVDDIIRTQAEKLQQGSELARVSLKEMDLPDSILALEGHSVLPTPLWEDVEAVQISGGPAGLDGELQQLRDLRRVNNEFLVQTEELLQKEAAEDTQFRSQFGTRWTRPQSSTLTKNLQDRLNRFAANLKQAADSDGKIERSVRDNMALMSILDRRPIESALPTLAKPMMSLDANEDAVVGTLKQSLRQLETLGAQRAGLEDMLKDMKRKDDILPKLMTSTGSYEDLFRKEISKYNHICEEISQNLQAQEQLLLQIQAQNREFAGTFNIEDYRAACDKCYKQIEAAVAKYREIKENINEGLKFYVTLQDAITSVKQQCSDFVMTRSIQCREMIEDVQRQMSAFCQFVAFGFREQCSAQVQGVSRARRPHTKRRRIHVCLV
ncbi:BRO1 domain, ALIX V-shaped domain protein [Artemisia annua]|uniref:BRO1 domain, ALIX V-shaped domain protein n=1 Tax=Artemisia annua TaxID=35608 RepID=A0A2U1Q1X7_ARTAN|nr:BRO1 domain, ALIX V-shaped domain protein [Artemisia annua]